MLQNLPNRVGVVFGLGLAKFVQTAPLKVQKMAEALQVVEAPEGDVYEAPEPQSPTNGKRASKGLKGADVSRTDDLEASL